MKTRYIPAAFFIIFAVIVFFLYKLGLFHGAHSWPEYKFHGKNIMLLRNYLRDKKINLRKVPIAGDDAKKFQELTKKNLSPSQELYKFSGGKEHEFWFFPIGTKGYGMYVLAENDKIILFQEYVYWGSL